MRRHLLLAAGSIRSCCEKIPSAAEAAFVESSFGTAEAVPLSKTNTEILATPE